MTGRLALLLALAAATAAEGQTLVAARTLRAQTVLAPGDVLPGPATVAGALADAGTAIGRETRVILYAGQPIRPGDLGPPALIERNQRVTLVFRQGLLEIVAEGRALDRGGAGEIVRVMNLDSRNTLTGEVAPGGEVVVAERSRGLKQ